MIAPRRLQLRRGNSAAVSTYLGAAGELIVNTDNNTLYIHDGVTVGGFATTINVATITNQIASVEANIIIANVGMHGYVDLAISSNIANVAAGYTNTNVKSYLGAFNGNIIPSANVTYSLGNITHQWRDLFVSNNTIYVGGVPLSIDNTGNLTINGNIIPTVAYVNTAVANVTLDLSSYALNANVTAANVGMQGYVDAQVANVTVDLTSYALNANVTAANVGLKGYVDQANSIQSAQLTSANVGIIGYINQANTIQSAQLTAANTAWAANASAQQTLISNLQASAYSNSNVSAFLVSHTDQTIGGNLTIQGNLTVNGNVTYISVNNVIIGDNIINLADLNPADSLDLGFAAHRTPSGQPMQHTGLIRDASANKWRLFSNVVPAPGTTVDFTDAIYDDLQLGNITSPTIDSLTLANTIQTQQIAAANVGIIGYIDQGNSIQATAITTANTGMKGYVDSQTFYSNARVATYLQSGNPSNISVAGNVTATYFVGDGSQLTGLAASYGNAQVATYLRYGNIANISVAGNVTATLFRGNGALLTGIMPVTTNTSANYNIVMATGSNASLVTGTGNGGTAATLNPYTGQMSISGLTIGGYGVSALTGFDYVVTLNGRALTFTQTGNLIVPGNVYANSATITGNVTANYFVGNGALLTGIVAGSNYSNVQVAAYLSTATIDTTGNITAQYISGNISITGNVTGTSPNVTLQAGAYTSVFDNQGNVRLPTAYVTGNVTANYFVGNGALLTGIAASSNYSNVDVANYLPTYTGAVQTGNLTIVNGGYFNADFSNTNVAARAIFRTTTTNGNTGIYATPNGTATNSFFTALNSSDVNNNSRITISAPGNTDVRLVSGASGTGAYLPLSFLTNNATQMQLTVTGNLNMTVNNSIETSGTGYHIGNAVGTTATYTGNVSANYFVGNGALLTGIVASGGNYSNVDVANYLPTYTGNVANLTLGPSGILTFADGTTQITAGGGSYSNVNVTTFLANSRTNFFGNTSTHPLSSNVTQIFIGNSTSLTSGNGTSPFATSLMYNMYFAANNTPLVRNTQLGAGILSLDLNGFTVSGLATSQTANAAPTLTNLLRITSAGAATFVGAVAAGGVTSTGAIAVNSALGITSNQATQLIFNQTVTTITMGTGAATTINLGTTAAPTSNVFVGGTLGTNVYGLTLRANGQFNLVTSLTSAGGYATTTYTGIPVTGGSGNGMIISMSGVASGYLGSATITNPGTGYRSGDTITIPAGNPVGSLGGSFVLQNYHATRSNIGTGIWQLGIDGNLTLAGNVIFPSNSYIFGDFSNATVNARTVFTPSAANASPGIYAAPSGTGTGASWQAANSGNLAAASKILIATNGSTDVQLVSGINGTGTYLPLSFYNNGAAQMQLTVSGNLEMTTNNDIITSGVNGYFIGNSRGTTAEYTGNVSANYFVGNGALLTGIVAGSDYSNVQVATYLPTYTGVVTASNVAVAGNVTAQYLFGNGSQLTGLPATYSNVQVATYLPTYTGNIANVRLSTSGVLTFPDGTQQTTAAFGGGSNYGNANVAAYLPTYTGTTGITQVGTLATLNVTGNTTVGNLVGTEANTRIIANTYVSTFDIYGNVTFPGNVIAPYFVGDGSRLTGIVSGGGSSYGNSNVAQYLQVGGVSNISVAGNVTATYFIGNGALLTGIVSGGSANIVAGEGISINANVISRSVGTAGTTGISQLLSTFGGDPNVQIIFTNDSIGSLLTPNYVFAFTGISGASDFTIKMLVDRSTKVLSYYILRPGDYTVTSGSIPSNYAGASGNVTVTSTLSFGSNVISSNGVVTSTLVVNGSGSTGGNVFISGNVIIGGAGYTPLPTTITQFTANANTYAQLNLQNISTGTDATAEYVATANNGTDTTFFVDLGIANRNYDVNSPTNSLGTTIYPNDSYLYAQGNLATTTGGNLAIGTSTPNKSVKIFAGGINSANIVATVSNTGLAVTGNVSATGNVNVTGYLVTAGGFGNISQVDYITANNVVATANVTVQGMGVTMPNRPAFRLNGTGLTAQTTSNVNLKGAAISTIYNQGSYFDATTGKFTAPVAGIYEVLLNARVNGSFDGLAQLVVLKNGLNTGGNIVAFWETTSNIGGATHFGVSGTVVLASGDYLSANILAGSVTFDQNDNWSVTYIG